MSEGASPRIYRYPGRLYHGTAPNQKSIRARARAREYAGIPGIARYKEQLKGKMRVDGNFLGSEDIRVHYAFGLLEKDALELMRPWVRTHRDMEGSRSAAFLEHLRSAYQDPELAEQARQKHKFIYQGNRSVLEYIAEYDKTYLEAQSGELPDWQKISDVRHGLNKKTGRLLVGTSQPKEYVAWCNHVKSLEREDAAEASHVNNHRSVSPTAQPPAPPLRSFSSAPFPRPALAPSQEPAARFPPVVTPPSPEVEIVTGYARKGFLRLPPSVGMPR